MVPAGSIDLMPVITAIIGSKNKIIFLDEPAQNLHPFWQRNVLESIRQASSSGNQIIVVTHSPYFITPFNKDMIERFSISNGSSTVTEIKEDQEGTEKRVVDWPKLVWSLFTQGAILAEGLDEELALEIWLPKAGFSPSEHQAQLIDVRSDTSFEWFGETLEKWGVPYVMFSDSKALKQQFVKSNKDLLVNTPKEDFELFLEDNLKIEFDEGKKLYEAGSCLRL